MSSLLGQQIIAQKPDDPNEVPSDGWRTQVFKTRKDFSAAGGRRRIIRKILPEMLNGGPGPNASYTTLDPSSLAALELRACLAVMSPRRPNSTKVSTTDEEAGFPGSGRAGSSLGGQRGGTVLTPPPRPSWHREEGRWGSRSTRSASTG